MTGFDFYLGAGFSALGAAYTLVALLARGPLFGPDRRPYVLNGLALCVLGVSLLGRHTFLPGAAVQALWGVAAALALLATKLIILSKRGT
ncbi:MAG: hypothetical protein QHJ73_05550 [Armatimonadota bacterium]|nr:hypothetical protein [Armatimonadota bacterium]